MHWSPPKQATDRVIAEAGNPTLNHYGAGAGLPELVTALQQKLATENSIHSVSEIAVVSTPCPYWRCTCCRAQVRRIMSASLLQCEVMVTAGANQAFTNVVLTLLDTKDGIVLFKPYYFNHLMAVQMTGGGPNITFGRCALRC